MNCGRSLLVAILPTAFALATPAPCQGTIGQGNVSYAVGSISTNQSGSVRSAFTASPSGAGDVIYAHWFHYRIDGDTDEHAFRNDGSLAQRYSGSHADLDWLDVDQRGRLRASLDIDVTSTGATSGRAVLRMTMTNISATALTLDLFTYLDLDICTTSNTAAGAGAHQIVTGSCPSEVVEFIGQGIDNWCVSAYDGSECGITRTGTIDLPNGSLPFGGDYTGAMQWRDRVLQPNESATYVSELCHNCNQCQTSASTANFGTGLAGSRGLPTIATTQLPVLLGTGEFAVGNSLPFSTALVVTGVGRANVQIGNLTLLVNAIGTQLLPLDVNGAGRVPLGIPGDPNLCGARIQFEAFFVDPAVQGAFPIAHTDGLEWTLGT